MENAGIEGERKGGVTEGEEEWEVGVVVVKGVETEGKEN